MFDLFYTEMEYFLLELNLSLLIGTKLWMYTSLIFTGYTPDAFSWEGNPHEWT